MNVEKCPDGRTKGGDPGGPSTAAPPPFSLHSADPLLPSVLGRSARSTKAPTAPPRGAGDLVLADPQRLAHPAAALLRQPLPTTVPNFPSGLCHIPLPCPTPLLPLADSHPQTCSIERPTVPDGRTPCSVLPALDSLPALPHHHLKGWPFHCVKREVQLLSVCYLSPRPSLEPGSLQRSLVRRTSHWRGRGSVQCLVTLSDPGWPAASGGRGEAGSTPPTRLQRGVAPRPLDLRTGQAKFLLLHTIPIGGLPMPTSAVS